MLLPEPNVLCFQEEEAIVELETVDCPVAAPDFIIYSTRPEVARASDGSIYFVKGQSDQVTFAEVAGLRLASHVGVAVPRSALCIFDGNLYAGAREIERAVRNVEPFLADPDRVRNHRDLYEVIAVDTWLANDDRNMGNVVGAQTARGVVEVAMIDFERSKTLREAPSINVANVQPRSLWPKEDLGRALRLGRPSPRELTMIGSIKAVTRGVLEGILQPLARRVPAVTWCDSSVDVLWSRSQQIRRLVEEVWDAS